jgi:hypothetical protein
MALWGKSELIYNSGKVTINFSDKQVKRHSGTIDFVAAGIKTGDVITVGAAGSIGAAVVSAIVGVHTISIASTNDFVYAGGNQHTNQDYYINEKPKYTLEDSTFDAPELRTTGFSTSLFTRSILGVDVVETGIARTAAGDAGKYAVEHAGWVGISSYTDCHGNLRVKSETLVAFSGITSDREDTLYPDS